MKKSSLIITELFLVKADWHRTFLGEIIRETQEDGSVINRGKVIIEEGMAWGVGSTQEELAENLDKVCTMKLDGGLHSKQGPREAIAGTSFYLN
jgi:hypothetical protein